MGVPKGKMSAKEWLLKYGKGLQKKVASKKCIESIGIHPSNFRRAWNAVHPTTQIINKFSGLDGFAELHDLESRIKRKDDHCKHLIEKFIKGPLLKHGWYYDSEAAMVAGLGTQDWARFREAHSNLQVKVNTDQGKKITWVHPTLVKRAREIAERS